LICKDFKEKNPMFHALTILGNLFRYLKLRTEAVEIFELCRDLANETEDWGWYMVCLENLSRTFRSQETYDKALNTGKVLLQVAWFTNCKEFESKAYEQIGSAYYYLAVMDRAKFYNKRVLNGIVEKKDSGERAIATALFERKLKIKAKKSKFLKLGALMSFHTNGFDADFTQKEWQDLWENVVRINEIRIRSTVVEP
jgi:tetratricopeptide (TPR) repeat protein